MTEYIKVIFLLYSPFAGRMVSIGFPKTTMREERRVALVPKDVKEHPAPASLHFEEGYATQIGIPDSEYRAARATIVPRGELSNLEVLCIPKRSHRDLPLFGEGQTIAGWLYVSQTPWLEGAIRERNMTAIAFEKMQYSDGSAVFWENNYFSGKWGIEDALARFTLPTNPKIAILGRGNIAKGAMAVLDEKGMPYALVTKDSIDSFYEEIGTYDVIINAVKLPSYNQQILTIEHLGKIKPDALIVDLSSEFVEGSEPQPIGAPIYRAGHFWVYNNEHIPTLKPREASFKNSSAVAPFIAMLTQERQCPVLENATLFKAGQPTSHYTV